MWTLGAAHDEGEGGGWRSSDDELMRGEDGMVMETTTMMTIQILVKVMLIMVVLMLMLMLMVMLMLMLMLLNVLDFAMRRETGRRVATLKPRA